ncbi:isopeptide-forming domain-containing fimbrial protein [Clostridium botulinum]|uniref:DUF11 domain-containing protein n=1 Tax=Clostridium botulinum TaxID=1491 RepID=A0A9Q1UX51_CLOBO|nr:isopeptide-forming domain-containing fimbrial protein [Clostridium botulinum]AEB76379.1 repeat domain protein [Clostridium botulinum BKT015925]KEI01235.1 hypothetical protein Z953_08980 [Clostridium botulinum D str. 16868]KEI04847.1 hypothetical protein Y848_11940 [Clostridium botulinum C/D str. Sp77]KLU75924.1 hypothetical protein CBC3_06300 [Clostridium botulinum V891]KOA75634.1 hypothetical protein ADU77_10825 [Clostridium botulinum]
MANNSFNNKLTEIYSTTTSGGIAFIGNTLGLSKAAGTQGPGTENSIGAFITTNPNLNVNNYPAPEYSSAAGTTSNMYINASSTKLTIPEGSTVLHAELIWGGTCKVGGEDYSSFASKPIQFAYPNGSKTINCDFFYQTDKTPDVVVYSCRTDVTSIVSSAGSGTYSAGSIVGTITASNDSDNCCGWTLAVAYENLSQPYRNLKLFAGMTFITPSAPYNQTIQNFSTPLTGTARVATCALGGDATLEGDQLLFGNSTTSLSPLSGPRNLQNNFFASQINNNLGETDTSGTFGDRNQNVLTNTNISAGRQGLDVTNVNASNILSNSDTSAIVQFKTAAVGSNPSNNYFAQALGVQLDMKCPILTATMSCDKYYIGTFPQTTTYTITIENIGTLPTTDGTLIDILPTGLVYNNDLKIDGVAPSAPVDLSKGVTLGSIAVGQKLIIEFSVNINTNPHKVFINSATINYDFLASSGTTLQGKAITNSYRLYPSGTIVPIPFEKLSDKTVVVPKKDTIKYTLNMTNTFLDPLININFQDAYIPREFSLINGSAKIIENYPPGNPGPEQNITNDFINSTLSINNISPNNMTTITFSVNVNDLPTGTDPIPVKNGYGNVAYLSFNIGTTGPAVYMPCNISYSYVPEFITKPAITITSDTSIVNVGDTIKYTVTVTNNNDDTILNPFIMDTLPQELSYIPNTLMINGSLAPSTASLTTGVFLSSLPKGSTATVSFQAKVNSNPTTGNEYSNFATVAYQIGTNLGMFPNSLDSSVINIPLSPTPILKPEVKLTTNKTTVNINDIVEYTASIKNTTGETITTATLSCNISSDLEFVIDSVTINGATSTDSIITGVALSNIPANATIPVIFKIKILSKPTNGTNYPLFVNLNSHYISSGNAISVTSQSNTVTLSTTSPPTPPPSNGFILNPICVKNHVYTTYKNRPLIVHLEAANLNKYSLGCTINTSPNNGFANINEDGIFKYTPKVNFIGKDSFSILLKDRDLGNSIVTITIIVKNFDEFVGLANMCNE